MRWEHDHFMMPATSDVQSIFQNWHNIYMGVVFIPLRLFPFRSSCASPLHALARPAFQSLLRFWKVFFLMSMVALKKLTWNQFCKSRMWSPRWWAGRCFKVAQYWNQITQSTHLSCNSKAMTLHPKRHRIWDGEPEVFQSGFRLVSDPFGGAHGALPFSGKEAELKHGHCPSKWSGNETKTYKINTSFLQLINKIQQWCCIRRSIESEMVSRKVFQNGFRPVSDPFGGAHGARG